MIIFKQIIISERRVLPEARIENTSSSYMTITDYPPPPVIHTLNNTPQHITLHPQRPTKSCLRKYTQKIIGFLGPRERKLVVNNEVRDAADLILVFDFACMCQNTRVLALRAELGS